MFSCCFQPSGGSGPRRAQNRGLGHLWRRWGEQESDFTVDDLCKFRSNIPGYLEKLVSYLASAVQTGDFLFVCTFLGIFQRFGTTWQVLDLIMKSCSMPTCHSAICFFLGLWMEKRPGDFSESPDLVTLNRLMNYVQLNMPSSALAVKIQELLSCLEDQESKKAKRRRLLVGA
ncbi:ral guanine nucleotide dissociation stimulator-like [Nannospalax galili]|uniref:ral guanine nucleotide dissociation stimulator-like n=1 Tax=Nannospalax galili TaxID=1026970 RepID=UPI00111C7376|nr:ral guanine nucleotide dissociation stimulator-like [Nannospalax galili]